MNQAYIESCNEFLEKHVSIVVKVGCNASLESYVQRRYVSVIHPKVETKKRNVNPPKKSDVSRIFIFSGQTKNVDLLDLKTKPLKKESKKQLFQGLMR